MHLISTREWFMAPTKQQNAILSPQRVPFMSQLIVLNDS